MKKKLSKGFMLVETLVVTTLATSVLITLYVQFNLIVKNFNKSFHYNNVNNLYATHNLSELIQKDGDGSFYNNLIILLMNKYETGPHFLEILPGCGSNTDVSYSTNSCDLFQKFTSFYSVEKILFTFNIIDFTDDDYKLIDDPNFETFIKSIKGSNDDNYDYRIIVKFTNSEYATLGIINDGNRNNVSEPEPEPEPETCKKISETSCDTYDNKVVTYSCTPSNTTKKETVKCSCSTITVSKNTYEECQSDCSPACNGNSSCYDGCMHTCQADTESIKVCK